MTGTTTLLPFDMTTDSKVTLADYYFQEDLDALAQMNPSKANKF